MDNNFNSLLKTNSEVVNASQSNDDVLKYSKLKIKNICIALCLPPQKYEPAKTVSAIQNYLREKASKERILYSEISSFVYGLSEDEQGNLETNFESLLGFVLDETNKVEEDPCKIVIKIYDHFQLAINQKNLNSETNNLVSAHLVDKVEKANELIENTSKSVKNIEKEYITILGIFASIVLAFVGGLAFSTSVLQNIEKASIYRLILVVDALAFVLTNVIDILVTFICRINEKTITFNTRILNIVYIMIAVLIVIAWAINAHSFTAWFRQILPWITT